jgi:hypothetical protein
LAAVQFPSECCGAVNDDEFVDDGWLAETVVVYSDCVGIGDGVLAPVMMPVAVNRQALPSRMCGSRRRSGARRRAIIYIKEMRMPSGRPDRPCPVRRAGRQPLDASCSEALRLADLAMPAPQRRTHRRLVFVGD